MCTAQRGKLTAALRDIDLMNVTQGRVFASGRLDQAGGSVVPDGSRTISWTSSTSLPIQHCRFVDCSASHLGFISFEAFAKRQLQRVNERSTMTVVRAMLMAGALAHSAHAYAEGSYGTGNVVSIKIGGGHKIQPNEDGMSMAAALRAKLDAIHAQHVTAEIGQTSSTATTTTRGPAPPPDTTTKISCYSGGDDCSDYENQWDPCNTFSCNRDEKRCMPEPREEGSACGESLDDYFFGECNEGPGFCRTIESEVGTFGMCMGIPKIGIPCDDYNECTVEDSCKVVTTEDGLFLSQCMGKFIGEGVACDDWDHRCTTNDRCQLVSTDEGDWAVCMGDVEEGKECNDFDNCTDQDQCVSVSPKWNGDNGARCRGKVIMDKPCNDYNECTDNDRCMEIADDYGDYGSFVVCRGDFAEGRSCMDYNECTVDDVCTLSDNGKWAYCLGSPQTGLSCDDYNQCTKEDKCLVDQGGWAYCKGEADVGATCDSFGPCSTSGTCVAESNDYNGVIYSSAWCKGAPNEGAVCDDYNDCTSEDTCVLGEDGDYAYCRGTPEEGKSCEDWNECTTDDKCVAADGWAWCEGGTPANPGTPCNDYSDYTTGDVCVQSDYGTYCEGTYESQ